MSKLSDLLRALIDGTEVEIIPSTKTQMYLVACIKGTGSEGLPEPTTVLGGLLCELADKLANGGSEGGSGGDTPAPTPSNTALQIVETNEKGFVTKARFNAPTIPDSYFSAHVINSKGNPTGAFWLDKIELGDDIEEIGAYAFENQKNMTEVVVPTNVEKIGTTAFGNGGVIRAYFNGTPTSINKYAFLNCDGIEFYVPWAEGAVSNAPWGAKNPVFHYNWTPED